MIEFLNKRNGNEGWLKLFNLKKLRT